jgi:hypothetical protein
VLPDKPCIWVKVYDHAKAANRVNDLKLFLPARNRSLQGTSSFVNLFLDRDNRPGHAESLITIAPLPKPIPAPVETEESLARVGRVVG